MAHIPCVLEPGEVGDGDALTLLKRPLPEWPVTRVNRAMSVDKADAALSDEMERFRLLVDC